MFELFLSGGISLFGLVEINPAVFTFLLFGLLFGGMNIIEFKRFD